MHTELITMPKAEAEALYRKYKEHVHYDQPVQQIDWEIKRTYELIAKGKIIIRAIESIKTGWAKPRISAKARPWSGDGKRMPSSSEQERVNGHGPFIGFLARTQNTF